ncbi:MAG: ATP-binding protein [Ignavibacteriaceae bacterium]|nr:ATP-binding protein [Ignavibacteriaceae bacterium]
MNELNHKNNLTNLRAQNQILKLQLDSIEKKYKDLLQEKESNFQSLLSKTRKNTESREWELIVDEMAHTFNTDIFLAQSFLLKLEASPNRTKAFNHLKHLRDLNDLIMWYLKRKDFIRKDEEIVKIDIAEAYQTQLNTVKEGITTLRLSVREHQQKLAELTPEFALSGNCVVRATVHLKDVFDLILKDLLRNAFKNTDEENPMVTVSLKEEPTEVELIITNNRLMPVEFKQWFVGDANIEPEISKSSKVGLRILKKWLTLLRIDYNVELDAEKNQTAVYLYIPKEIKVE